MKRKGALALILTLVMLGTAGCSTPTATVETTAAAGAETQQSGDRASGERIFRYSNTADIITIDPDKCDSVPDATVCYHIFDGLYRNVDGDIRPAEALRCDISEDGLRYTFHLREDGKWSDGQTVTAHDYEYGWKRLCDPASASATSYIGAVLKNGAAITAGKLPPEELGVRATDDFTLEVELESPADYFLGMLSMSSFLPVRKDLVEKYGERFGTAADTQVYNGPFMATEFTNGRFTMAKNENYYDADAIHLDGVEIKTVADNNTAVSLFESGELDLVEVSTDLVEQYRDKVQSYYSGANDYAGLNHRNQILANRNFRLAMNYAIDREEYNLLAHNGLYQANQRYVLPQVHGVEKTYGEEYPLEYYPLKADLGKAKDYLDKALQELSIADPSEIRLKMVVTDSDTATKEAQIVANMLQKNLGIQIDINMVPYATKNAMLVPNNDEYDIIMSGWAPDYSDPYSYLELWYSTSAYNYLNYHSDAYDGYIDASRTTKGAERMENLFSAEKTLLADGALVPLQLREVRYMVQEGVTGLSAYFVGLNYNYMFVNKR
ncbi:MAG: peptide ABC transporter substrate-binding protein [Stomatobaculum sp.]